MQKKLQLERILKISIKTERKNREKTENWYAFLLKNIKYNKYITKKKYIKSEKNIWKVQSWGSAFDSEDGLRFHGSVDNIGINACVKRIKPVVSRVILRYNDLARVKIKRNLVKPERNDGLIIW